MDASFFVALIRQGKEELWKDVNTVVSMASSKLKVHAQPQEKRRSNRVRMDL